jgi:hypothetical protein
MLLSWRLVNGYLREGLESQSKSWESLGEGTDESVGLERRKGILV